MLPAIHSFFVHSEKARDRPSVRPSHSNELILGVLASPRVQRVDPKLEVCSSGESLAEVVVTYLRQGGRAARMHVHTECSPAVRASVFLYCHLLRAVIGRRSDMTLANHRQMNVSISRIQGSARSSVANTVGGSQRNFSVLRRKCRENKREKNSLRLPNT